MQTSVPGKLDEGRETQFLPYRILVEDSGSHLVYIGSVRVTDVGTNDAVPLSFLNHKLLIVMASTYFVI